MELQYRRLSQRQQRQPEPQRRQRQHLQRQQRQQLRRQQQRQEQQQPQRQQLRQQHPRRQQQPRQLQQQRQRQQQQRRRQQLQRQVPNGCFYGKDKVQLINGETRSIESLRMGDPVWSISRDGNSLVEDEVIMMMHNEPNISTLFYTFKTIDGHEVSLTDRHNIPIFDQQDNKIKIKRSSLVTREHYLIMLNRKIKIANITLNNRIGYYSPLTLTGYLLVNNISISVFSDSYQVSSDTVQFVFLPIRLYYRLTRWIYGNNYSPFKEIKEGLHPIAQFYKDYQDKLRFLVKSPKYICSTIIIMMLIKFIQTHALLK
ncbi:unnamed protein product [Adineta steineri]|uniref:Hint domain-containing protein n=1 Tax=Adineta steineri TaxID=433720 RepID=A0A819QSC0_9BILA|nr:unnamed protein product [Adineta steineri]CAF4035691.1 unnamed protein product [Adineta steineri]